MKNIYKIYLLSLLVLSVFSCSQRRNYLSKADQHYLKSKYKTAIPLYLHAYQLDSTDSRIIERLAISYKNIKDYDKAEKWFSRAVKLNSQNSENALFYAQVLASNGKYQSSDEWYKKHMNMDQKIKIIRILYQLDYLNFMLILLHGK